HRMAASRRFGAGQQAFRNRQVRRREHLFRPRLVHRQGRGEHAGMRVGNPQPFEDALDASVLAPATMQRVEDDIRPGTRKHLGQILPGIDLDYVESFTPQRSRAFASGNERYLALGRPAALEHCDTGACPARHARLVRRPGVHCPEAWLFAGSHCSPTRMISHSRLIPVLSKTFFRTSSPRDSRSAAFAPPALTRKFGCNGDIIAPPSRAPRIPASSMSFQALRSWTSSSRPVEENPAGLRKVDPAERSFTGCVASRLVTWASIRARIASGASSGPS